VQLGRHQEAVERFAEALRLNPHYPKAAEQLEAAQRQAAGSQ
jgi:hypothetical protein